MRVCLLILFMSWEFMTAVAQPNGSAPVEQLKQQLNQAQHDTTRLRLIVAIGQQYLEQNRFDSLYPYIQRSMQLLTRVFAPNHASDTYFLLARYQRNHGMYQQAIQSIQHSLAYAQKIQSVKRIAECHYNLAMLYSDAGQSSNAINQITTNLNYLREHDDKPMLAANYLLIIELFIETKNKPMQELYINRYIDLANHSLPYIDQAYAYLFKADLLTERGYLKESSVMYQKALHYAYLTHNPIYIIEVINSLSTHFRQTGQYQAAIQSFSKTFVMAQSINDLGSMSIAKCELATTYLAVGQPKDALREARYALTLARQNKTPTSLMTALACLGKVLEANSLYREALNANREQALLKEQKYTKSAIQQIAQMQAQFETANKEQTIKILQKNAQINQLKVLRQQQQISQSQRTQLTNAIIISLLFLLIGAIYLFLWKSQRAYTVLQQTARELSEANEVKNKLFSVISHDLRSPIASMKTTIYLAQEDNESSIRPVVNRLKRQVDGVLDLLTNLLDWSLIQFNGFDPIQESICLHDILVDTVSQADDLLEEKQLGVANQVPHEHVVLGGKHQLRAVIRNVLHNAIKFTPPGGYIRLHSVSRAGYVELSIRDSGVGISAEQLTNLFSSPEVRTGTMGESGTGLGLRISRELVERQGGSLLVESWPQGGTLVKIRLISYAKQPVGSNVVESV